MGKKRGPQEEKSEGPESTSGLNPHENSVTYRKNKKTGEWEIINPAGAIAYNYIYREDKD
jgi:hypothetical protein